MKILELRFKNLNSLYGEWVIDFTDPEYVSNGIFALIGPTGAGKSTILDAICLALYGATPRLGKITKKANEIMSRQTGECYAEVLFESQAGRFRCHWEQRRARKKVEGNLQDQEHQIIDGDTARPIETKKSLVGRVIEEKTGMDFDRFTRSILLAQGGFDTFLKADVEQKSKILEQITGTEIYSEISRRVHDRQRDEREKLNIMNAETSGIVLLEPEEEKAMQEELVATQRQESALVSKLAETGKVIAWLTTIENLKKEIFNLTDEDSNLKADVEAFKLDRMKLERAVQAASLDGIYATLEALRKQQKDDQTSIETDEAALPALELSANTQAEALNTAEQITLKAKIDQGKAVPLIRGIRTLDQKIAALTKAVSEGADACRKGAIKIAADKRVRVNQLEKRKDAVKILDASEQYLRENARDEWLISELAGVEEQIGNLLIRQQELTQKEADLNNAEMAVADATKKLEGVAGQCSLRKQELEEAGKKLQQGRDALRELLGDKLLREYRAEKEMLLREMAFIRKIEELEDHRGKLEDGKCCPLCGSTDHPFAEGNIPVPDEIEQKIASLTNLIDRADELETAITQLERVEAVARKKLIDSEKLEINAANDKKVTEKVLTELKMTLSSLRDGFDELKLAASIKLQPLGITEISEAGVDALLHALKSRRKMWQEQAKQKTDVEKQIADIDSEIRSLDAVIDTQLQALKEKQENLDGLKKELEDRVDERKRLYGDKNPDVEEVRLSKMVADAEQEERQARCLNVDLQQKLIGVKTRMASFKKRIAQRAPELKTAETDCSAAMSAVGFADENEFLDARLPQSERDTLELRAKELDNAVNVLHSKMADHKDRLDLEMAKDLTDKSLNELESAFRGYEETLRELRDAVAELKLNLRENLAAKERVAEKKMAIETQKKACQHWEKLHYLIGSSDGKKYRNFAQGLTFELLVSHANRQLAKMTDRYLLIRDHKNPLELNVIDNHQAGEIRSTKNLSGGESFIVSLTLALGLSKMASRKVRVDSLFLDEGFGSLDNDSLEVALETLSSL